MGDIGLREITFALAGGITGLLDKAQNFAYELIHEETHLADDPAERSRLTRSERRTESPRDVGASSILARIPV